MEEVSVLIGKSQSGDKEAREVLIEKNLGLVHHIVKRFLGRGYDPEDLFQIGVIGLMKAIDKFDLKLEVRFSTYAVPMITGESGSCHSSGSCRSSVAFPCCPSDSCHSYDS